MRKYYPVGILILFIHLSVANSDTPMNRLPRSPYQIILDLKFSTLNQDQVRRLVQDIYEAKNQDQADEIFEALTPHFQNRQTAQWFVDEFSKNIPNSEEGFSEIISANMFKKSLEGLRHVTNTHTDLNFEATIPKLRPYFKSDSPYLGRSRVLLVRMRDAASIPYISRYNRDNLMGVSEDVFDYSKQLLQMDAKPEFEGQVLKIADHINEYALSPDPDWFHDRWINKLTEAALELSKKYPSLGQKLFDTFSKPNASAKYRMAFADHLFKMGDTAKKYLPKLREWAEHAEDTELQTYSTRALGNVASLSPKDTSKTVDFLLTYSLKKTNLHVREGAAHALTAFKKDAYRIVPELSHFITQSPSLGMDTLEKLPELGPQAIDLLPELIEKAPKDAERSPYTAAIESISEAFKNNPQYHRVTEKILPKILRDLNSDNPKDVINATNLLTRLRGPIVTQTIPQVYKALLPIVYADPEKLDSDAQWALLNYSKQLSLDDMPQRAELISEPISTMIDTIERERLFVDKSTKFNDTLHVLESLGSLAKPAFPAILDALKNNVLVYDAEPLLRTLYAIDPHDDSILLALMDMSLDSLSDMKAFALGAISQYPDKEISYRFLDQFVNELNHPHSSQELVQLLDKISLWQEKSEYAIPKFIELLHHENLTVQISALATLGQFPESTEVWTAMMDALSIPELRTQALMHLRKIHGHENEIFYKVLPFLNDSDPEIKRWATIVLEENYAGLTPEEKIEANSELSKISSMKHPPDPCESLCNIVKSSDSWAKFGSPRNLAEAEFPFALTPLGALFMIKAAPYCAEAQSQVNQILQSFSDRSEIAQLQNTCPTSSFDQIQELYLRVIPLLNHQTENEHVLIDSLFLYGKLFYKKLFEELLKQKNISPSQQRNLETLLNQSKSDLISEVSHAKERGSGKGGSYFNTYALATSVLALDPGDISKENLDYLTHSLSKDTGHVTYSPGGGGLSHGDPLASVARAVPYWISQYERNFAELNENLPETRTRLISALEDFSELAPLLSGHQTTDFPDRLTAHGGPFVWAPYYYPSTIPYATAAVQMLIQESKPEEAARLKKIRNQLEASLLNQELFKDDAFFRQEAAWAGSYDWDIPLLGLAVIPLAERCSTKEDSTIPPLGILRSWPQEIH